MVSKVYSFICGLFAITAAFLFLTGNFPAITAIILGLIAFGLVFMGMMFVLPYTITHTSTIPAKGRRDQKVAPASSFKRPVTQSGEAHSQPA